MNVKKTISYIRSSIFLRFFHKSLLIHQALLFQYIHQSDEYIEKAKQQEKDFNPKMKVKIELKLHVIYEGWKKGDSRHSLVNKEYIAGIMKPKEMASIKGCKSISKI